MLEAHVLLGVVDVLQRKMAESGNETLELISHSTMILSEIVVGERKEKSLPI